MRKGLESGLFPNPLTSAGPVCLGYEKLAGTHRHTHMAMFSTLFSHVGIVGPITLFPNSLKVIQVIPEVCVFSSFVLLTLQGDPLWMHKRNTSTSPLLACHLQAL